MKRPFAAPLVLLVVLAGCADQQSDRVHDMNFATETKVEEPVREAGLLTQPDTSRRLTSAETGAPAAEPEPKHRETSDAAARDEVLRQERRDYARGLERILVSHGMSVGVVVYEGPAGPAPTLMFVGSLSREFVQMTVTKGAVLERARTLGFRSVDFFDRGPDSHYQFVLSKTQPLPRCAAYNRLCLR
jgi:hypothetical protein